ncbi:MAG: ureidoglycolate lyase [Granulosicoccus sp.]
MSRIVTAEPLNAKTFERWGDVIEARGEPTVMINRGKCARFSDLAAIEFAEEGRAAISVFKGEPYELPLTLDLMERHPLGSQAFLPLSEEPFLIIVADDDCGRPSKPRAFVSRAGQGVNYRRNTWHGVLTPLTQVALFAVVDRIGSGENLEEHTIADPWTIVLPD